MVYVVLLLLLLLLLLRLRLWLLLLLPLPLPVLVLVLFLLSELLLSHLPVMNQDLIVLFSFSDLRLRLLFAPFNILHTYIRNSLVPSLWSNEDCQICHRIFQSLRMGSFLKGNCLSLSFSYTCSFTHTYISGNTNDIQRIFKVATENNEWKEMLVKGERYHMSSKALAQWGTP